MVGFCNRPDLRLEILTRPSLSHSDVMLFLPGDPQSGVPEPVAMELPLVHWEESTVARIGACDLLQALSTSIGREFLVFSPTGGLGLLVWLATRLEICTFLECPASPGGLPEFLGNEHREVGSD